VASDGCSRAQYSCPATFGQPTVILALHAAGKVLAAATYGGACAGMNVTVEGRARTPLADAYPFVSRIEHLLHIKLTKFR
jgi:hypothetical protein